MARAHAELEIVLRWRGDLSKDFDISLAYDDPNNPDDRRDFGNPFEIDVSKFAGLVASDEGYGRQLTELLFGQPKVRSFYDKAMTTAGSMPLHLRLLVDPSAPAAFHAIRWEAIRDPDDGLPLATRDNVYLTRFLSSPDWRPVTVPAKHRRQALVVVAGPSDVGGRTVGRDRVELAPIDVAAELERARAALCDVDVVELSTPGVTLQALVAAVRRGVDVLYLVCHGAIDDSGEPMLFLEDDHGRTKVENGRALAEHIAVLDRRPTIAVLCSCQSSGRGDRDLALDEPSSADGGALSALGPLLARAGVPSVVAMQGDVTQETAATFIPAFFRELAEHGIVDRAVAIARSEIRGRPRDWWVPVLYSRLKHGRTYYLPEFGERTEETFRTAASQVLAKECVPIVGSGVSAEDILPSREELAGDWATLWQMPLPTHMRSDLARVAQYLSVRTSADHPQTELQLYFAKRLRELEAEAAPPAAGEDGESPNLEDRSIAELIQAAGRRHRELPDTLDPYRMLAQLRLPVYITTGWSSLLEDAIEEELGHKPTVEHFEWYRARQTNTAALTPSSKQPLVYHLFGSFEEADSLVITEDDYFAWLTQWIKRVDKDDSIPKKVREALTNKPLLFLGYGLDDWEFRVLFQSLKSFEGSRLHRKANVGVQVSPDLNQTIEPEAAQEYLESYFGRPEVARVAIYWGTTTRFLDSLHQRIRQQAAA